MRKSLSLLIFTLLYITSIQTQAATRIVAVIDTGFNLNDVRAKGLLCPTGHKDFTNTGLQDTVGHGTFVVGNILSQTKRKDFCLLIIKWFNSRTDQNQRQAYLDSVRYASRMADIVNMSISGGFYYPKEYNEIKTHPNVQFIVAAGNEHKNLDVEEDVYPANYKLKNIIVVGDGPSQEERASYSNYGSVVSVWIDAKDKLGWDIYGGTRKDSGTSFATATYTGRYLNVNP